MRGVQGALLLVAGCLLGLALLEGAVRLLGLADHLVTDPAYVSDPGPGVGYRYKSNFRGRVQGPTHITTNSFGARDREFARARPPGTLRIVVMGDSIAFGQGVEQDYTFPKVLERELQMRLQGRSVQVINLGVQGYSLPAQVARYFTEAIHFHPDIAMLASIADDLDLSRDATYVDPQGYLTKSLAGQGRWKAFLRHFHTAYLVKGVFYELLARLQREASSRRLSDETLGQRLDLLEEEVGKFVLASEQAGIVPMFAMVDVEQTRFTDAVVARVRQRFPGLPVVDCAPVFQVLGPERFVLPRDGHPNAEAHRLMADLILKRLLAVLGKEASAPGPGSAAEAGGS